MSQRLLQTLALAAGAAFAAAGQAQPAWPAAKPITIIVPFSAGGSVDVSARLVGQKLGERLRQSVVVENVAGAGGVIGVARAVQAAPDGYTLVLGADSPIAISRPAVSQVQSKRLKAIAVTSDRRLASLPEVATVAENTAFKGYNVVAWTGLFAPAQTPPAIVERLSKELEAVLRSDEVRDKLAEQGALPGSGSPSAFGAFVAREEERYAKVVKAANIRE